MKEILEQISTEIVESDISAHDFRIVMDIINKYKEQMEDKR